jgi:hypothetical protein
MNSPDPEGVFATIPTTPNSTVHNEVTSGTRFFTVQWNGSGKDNFLLDENGSYTFIGRAGTGGTNGTINEPDNITMQLGSGCVVDGYNLTVSGGAINQAKFQVDALSGIDPVIVPAHSFTSHSSSGDFSDSQHNWGIGINGTVDTRDYTLVVTVKSCPAANNPPTVSTTAASSVDHDSAVLAGNVTSNGGATVTERGYVLSATDSSPQIGESNVTKITDGSGTGVFSETRSSLSGSTQYWYQAYATNSVGTSYGGVQTFTTAVTPSAPTVTTTAPTGTGLFQSTFGGNVTASGTQTVTERGVVWSRTDATPTIGEANVFKVADGSGTGSFSEVVTGLEGGTKQHYVAAYAINSVGTAYGSVQTTTTTDLDWTLLSQIEGIAGPAALWVEGNDMWVGSPSSGNVIKTNKDDRSNQTVIFDETAQVWDMVVDGDDMYVTDNVRNDVFRFNKADGSNDFQTSDLMDNPVGLAVDGTHAYVVDHLGNGAVYRFSKTDFSGKTAVVSNVVDGAGIEVDDTYIYWTEKTKLYRTPKATPGAKEEIWSGFSYLWGTHLVGNRIYMVDLNTGSLWVGNKDGSGLLTQLRTGLTGVRSVFVDGAGDIHMGLWTGSSVVRLTETAPELSFSQSSQSVAERGNTATVTAQLNETIYTGGPTVTATVNLGGTATNTTDYSVNTTAISIPAGTSSQDLTVSVVDDTSDESDETVVLSFTGIATADAGTSATHTITIQDDDPQDWGDAPDATYPTLAANNGPRHVMTGPQLGSNRDAETDGQQNADASGDDGDGTDDDDGITWDGTLQVSVLENVTITASATAKLDAWIDFNRDGDWSDAGEQIFTSQALTAGANALSFTPPGGATVGTSFARFRISTSGGLSQTGWAADGEVEDYEVSIINNQAPTLTGMPTDRAYVEDVEGNLDLSAVTTADADGDALTLTLTASAGAFSTPVDGANVVETLVNATTITLAGSAANLNTYLDTASNLKYTPAADVNGGDVATFSAKVNDGTVDSATSNANVDVTAVNDVPSFTKGADVAVNEDSGAYSSAFATAISAGPADEAGQTLTFAATNNNNALFAVQPAVAANGTLTFTPASNANGVATVTVSISDDGGTTNGGVDTSADQTFTITVSAVNDDPTVVSVPSDVTVIEDVASNVDLSALTFADLDAGANDISLEVKVGAGVLAASDAGGVTVAGSGTSTLTLTGTATEIDTYLNTASAIKYTGAGDANGEDAATLTLTGNDQGHVGSGGGTDVQLATVNIDITAVNDVPSFTKGADQAVNEDAGLQTVNAWATNLSTGPADEAGQTLSFAVSNNNNALFAVQPSIAANGTLTYTPADDMNGVSTVTVSISDNGGTANGGVDTSADQTFTITVNAVNDVPVITSFPTDLSFVEDTQGYLDFSVFSVTDVEGDAVTVTLTASAGSFASPVSGSGVGAGVAAVRVDAQTVTLSGAAADVSQYMRTGSNQRYTPALNVNGNDVATISVKANDGTADSATSVANVDVSAVNDDPTVVSVPSDVTVIEDVASNVDLSELTLADIDAGANDIELEVKVGAGVLAASDAGGVTVTGSGTGTITLTGTASEIDTYLNTASAIKYTGAGDANGEDAATLTLTGNDQGHVGSGGGADVQLATVNIDITAVNDVPSFTKGADQAVNEDAGLQTVNAWATNLSTGPADEAGQTLSFAVSNNNNALFAVQPSIAANGTLTYTPADDMNGVSTVTVSISDNGGTANGGVDTSADQTFTITVNAVNDVPVITSFPTDLSFVEDTQGYLDFSVFSVTDVEGDAVTVTLTASAGSFASPVSGSGVGAGVAAVRVNAQTVTLSGAAADVSQYMRTGSNQRYTPALNVNGNDVATISVKANDGTADSATSVANVDVTAVNDIPSFAKGVDQTVDEDAGAQTVNGWATNLSKGPADEAAQTLSFTVSNDNNPLFSTQPSIAANGTLTYTPADDMNGVATVTVSISDNGGTANGGVDTSADQTFTITVNEVNDAPIIAAPATASLLENGSFVFEGANAIAISDTDIAGGFVTVTMQATSTVSLGATDGIVINSGQDGTSAISFTGTLEYVNAALTGLTYRPSTNQTTGAQLTISVTDNGGTGSGGAKTDSKTVAFTVTPVNSAPSFAKGANQSVSEDAGAQSTGGWATAINPGDPGETGQVLAFELTNDNNSLFAVQPAVAADGTLTFTPADDAHGSATVEVVLKDDGGTDNGGSDTSPTQSFQIQVNSVNDAPSFTKGGDQSTSDVAGAQSVANWATDLSAGPANEASQTLSFVVSNNANGLFSAQPAISSDGTLTWTPKVGTGGTATVTVKVQDDGGTSNGGVDESASTTFSITVVSSNAFPVVGDDAYSLFAGGTLVMDVLDNDSDPESTPLTITQVTQPGSGAVAIVGGTQISYTANATFEGQTSFTYTVADGGGATATGTVTLTLMGRSADGDGVPDEIENDGPNGGDGNFDGQPDSGQLNVATLPVLGTTDYVSIQVGTANEVQNVQSIPNPSPTDVPMDASFPLGFLDFEVTNVDVGGTNNITIYYPPGTPVNGYWKYGPTPANPTPHWYDIATQTEDPDVRIAFNSNAIGFMVITLKDGAIGDDDLTANGTIVDPGGLIIVPNDAPVGGDDYLALVEDQSGSIDVLANDSDPEGERLSITSITETEHASITVDESGKLNVVPAADYHGSFSVEYTLMDVRGDSAIVTLNVEVSSVPEPPRVENDSTEIEEDSSVDVNVFANDSEPDGESFSLIRLGDPEHGKATYLDGGIVRYVPDPGYSGVDSFEYEVEDTSGERSVGIVTITVVGTNDAPVAVADTPSTLEDTTLIFDALSNDTDEDGDTLSITEYTQPLHGSVSIVDGQFVYLPNADYSGTDTFAYTISDGAVTVTGSVTITVAAVNDAPVFEGEAITGPVDVVFLSESAYEVTYSEASDVDDTALTYVWQLSTSSAFDAVLLSVEVSQGVASIPAVDLIAALEPEGLGYGDQLTVYQRMKATDDENASGTSAAQEVTFARSLNVSNEGEGSIPTEYFLSDNYPNPFNPSTTIEFGLPQAAHVSIQLFDMSGRMVQVVVDRQLAPGTHRERIDMGTLPSGVYLYRMTVGNQVFTKTLHLIK